MARPSYKATESDKQTVQRMAAMDCRHDDISKVLAIPTKTLRKHYRTELEKGAIEANLTVMESLFKMATSGTNTAAATFWVKTRCGMREKPRSREEAGNPPAFVVKVA